MADTDWTPIESSFLKQRRYDPNSRVLEVEYHNGGRYTHHDVPADKFAALIENPSPGSYYNRRIQPMHPGRKL